MTKFIDRPFIFSILIITVFLFSPANSSPDAAKSSLTKKDLLEKLRERYAAMTDLSADYHRTTASPAMDNVFMAASRDEASGRLIFKKPNKLFLDQLAPEPQKMVTDGSVLWWYIPADNLVQKYRGEGIFAELAPLLDFLNGLDRLEGSFMVRLGPMVESPREAYELILTSLKEDADFKKISIRLEARDYTLIGFKTTTALGETTDFSLTNIKFNQGIADDVFSFNVPEGARVVGPDPP